MKRYPEYKDSEFDWIGEIPEHWKVKRIKHVTSKVGSGITPKGGAEVYQENGVPLLRSQNVYNDGFRLDDVAYISDEIHQNMSGSLVLQGDILLNITGGSIGRSYYVSDEFEEANVNQHVCILRPNKVVNAKFLHAFIISQYGQLQIQLCQVGGNREAVNFEQIKNFYIPWVNYEEQTNIANYLDQKTSEIDTLIDKKKQLIALYQEERTATINQAVTKGLDLNAPMKNSSIDWIGEIPKHWEEAKLKLYSERVTDGAHVSPDRSKEDYPFVSTVDIKDGKIDFENCLKTSTDSFHQLVKNGCQPFEGDILFSKDGTIGRTCVIDFELDFVVASSLVIISPNSKKINVQFLDYVFNSRIAHEYTEMLLSGSALRRISITKIGNMTISIPPIDEQTSIANWLDNQLSQLDGRVSKTEKEISLLEEYKTALISEVVLGKVDVREEVLN